MSFEYGAKPANQVNQPNKIKYLFLKKHFYGEKFYNIISKDKFMADVLAVIFFQRSVGENFVHRGATICRGKSESSSHFLCYVCAVVYPFFLQIMVLIK